MWFFLSGLTELGYVRAEKASRVLPGEARQPVLVWVNAGAMSRQKLALGKCEVIETVIDQDEPELRIRILSPSGEEVRKIQSGYPGRLLVSFEVPEEGPYVFELDTTNALARDVQLRIRIASNAIGKIDLRTRIEAEDLFFQAQKLRTVATAKAAQEAIELFRSARKKWAAVADENGQALALAAEADVWLGLSRYEDAIRSLAVAHGLAHLDVSYKSFLLDEQIRIDLDLWDSSSALSRAKKLLNFKVAPSDRAGEADGLADEGEAQWLMSNDEEAAADLTTALDAGRESGNRFGIARALRCQAWIEEDRGHMTQAVGLMQRAEEMFRYVGDVRDSLGAVSDIATLVGMTGDHFAALLTHTKVADVINQSGQESIFAFVLNNIGSDYAALNRDTDAISYFEKSERIFSGIHHISGQLSNLDQLCTAELQINRISDAFSHCQKAVSLSKLALDPKRQAIAEWRLAKVYKRMGHVQTALNALNHAVSMSEAVHDSRFESLALLDMGEILGSIEKDNSELRSYEKALELAHSAEDETGATEAQFHVARFEAAHHHADEAKKELNELLQSIEKRRLDVGNDELRSSYFTIVRKCYSLYVDVLMEEHERDPQRGLDRRALEMSEAGRGRTLLDSLDAVDSARGNALDTPVERTAQLRVTIAQLYDERLKMMLAGDRPQEMRQNAAQLRQLINDYDRQADLIRGRPRSLGASAKPMTADELREATNSSDYAFFEYALGERRSYLWVMYRGSLEGHILPGEAQISNAVTRWRTLVSSRARGAGEEFTDYLKRVDASDHELPQTASGLSCMLFGKFLKPEMKRVAVVADGILQGLSFSALPSDGCETASGSPVVTEHEIVNIPSVSVLLAPKRSALHSAYTGDLAVLADPVFEEDDPRVVHTATTGPGGVKATAPNFSHSGSVLAFPRLIATRQEALSITSLLPPERVLLAMDFDASVKTVLSNEISNYRILHVATHGTFDRASPELSGLVFSLFDSQGRPVHGFVTAHELSDMNLRNDLVVLSSCDTALGGQIDEEGIRGLAYAFLHAGARNVVSALWNIDDDVSSRLMISFYKSLIRSNELPSEALREAQLEILKQPRTAHPFYWAGFVITSGSQ
jgi:predicted negative regulator of RcsB-dependent stress response